jgi:hypothetical protein
MAVYQILFILVNLALLTRGEIPYTNWTTVYQFWPTSSGNNYIVLAPMYSHNIISTGYSICLRVCFWKRGHLVVFDSPAVQLDLVVRDSSLICFTIKEYYNSICFSGQLSSEWNALCITHNLTDFVFNITLNGELIGSEKVDFTSDTLEKLAEPFSIGSSTSFWGQITDFNIWSRTLSNKELNQYSFGCQEGLLTQPEILDWANTNITNSGYGSAQIQMQKQLQTCQYKKKKSHDLFQNTLAMSYNKSSQFCNFLRGDLIDPFKEELIWLSNHYWVPIVYPNVVNKTNNSILTTGQEADQCMSVDIASKEYLPRNCSEKMTSICKVKFIL